MVPFPWRLQLRPLLLFLTLTCLLVTVAVFYYRNEQGRLRGARSQELKAVAEFKSSQLELWLTEQQRITGVWRQHKLASDLAGRWLTSGAVTEAEQKWLRDHLEVIRQILRCEAVSVVDLDGVPRLQAGAVHPLPSGLARQVAEVAARGKTQWSDFYWHQDPGRKGVYLDLIAPLFAPETGRAIGALVVHVDPAAYLSPLIRSWPVPSATAEGLLVRKQGDNVLFLTELRHRKDTALAFSLPLTEVEVPAVQAALGATGIVEGRDYRGEPVLAAILPVASTPWQLVTKIDTAEVYAPLRREALQVGLAVAVLVLTLAGITGAWWRRERLVLEMRYRQSDLERKVVTQRLHDLARNANDIILLIGPDGRLLDCNDRALAAYGYDRDQLLSLTVRDVLSPTARATADDQLARSLAADGLVFESEHRHRNGETFPVEISARRIEQGGQLYVQQIIRDISERKRAEGQLRLAARVFDGSHEGILITDRNGLIVAVNSAFTEITGFTAEEMIGSNPSVLSSGRHDPAFYRAMWEALATTGHWQGEIWNRRKSGEVYPEWLAISAVPDEQGRLVNYIGVFSDVTARKAAEEHIEFLALHDPLTRLPNRKLLLERLDSAVAAARRAGRRVGLLFVDLDDFKTINDSLGHLAGDEVLQQVADRLRSCVREADTLARFGGDEFMVVASDIHAPSDAAVVAEKLIDALKEPVLVDERRLTVSPSIGITIYPEDGVDSGRLIQNADAAMYRAKATGRAAYRFYTPDLNARAVERLRLEGELRQALEDDQFEAYYQPLCAVEDGSVLGFEALIRWRRPNDGLTLPAQFIPLAEDSGLILPIGERMLALAGRQIATWRAAGLQLKPVAVNLSAKQFRSPGFADRAVEILASCDVAPSCVELELTETMLMDSVDTAMATVRSLKRVGFRLVLDDFGTGYSSLNYLKRFAFDTLKIDRSFVKGLPGDAHDAAIVEAILKLAQALGFEVVAEGVETLDQLAFLAARGCRSYQGYLASRPVPPAETDHLLAGLGHQGMSGVGPGIKVVPAVW